MTRWISLIAVALTAVALVAGCGQKEEQAQVKETAEDVQVVSAQIVDPVCGMEVDAETAMSAEYQDKTYYFCSAECHEKFMQDPTKYMSAEEHRMEESHEGHGH